MPPTQHPTGTVPTDLCWRTVLDVVPRQSADGDECEVLLRVVATLLEEGGETLHNVIKPV
jgi:hypothetical protein